MLLDFGKCILTLASAVGFQSDAVGFRQRMWLDLSKYGQIQADVDEMLMVLNRMY